MTTFLEGLRKKRAEKIYLRRREEFKPEMVTEASTKEVSEPEITTAASTKEEIKPEIATKANRKNKAQNYEVEPTPSYFLTPPGMPPLRLDEVPLPIPLREEGSDDKHKKKPKIKESYSHLKNSLPFFIRDAHEDPSQTAIAALIPGCD